MHVRIVTALVIAAVALSITSASAQWRRGPAGALGVSYAYGSDPNGARLEYSTDQLVFDGLYFRDRDRDSTIIGLEVGWKASSAGRGLGGSSLVVGAGYYNDDPAELAADSGVGFWAGLGDFSTSKGIFYQFRYSFNGPLKGSQGIVGWRF